VTGDTRKRPLAFLLLDADAAGETDAKLPDARSGATALAAPRKRPLAFRVLELEELDEEEELEEEEDDFFLDFLTDFPFLAARLDVFPVAASSLALRAANCFRCQGPPLIWLPSGIGSPIIP
jgi:hypothetical protein